MIPRFIILEMNLFGALISKEKCCKVIERTNETSTSLGACAFCCIRFIALWMRELNTCARNY